MKIYLVVYGVGLTYSVHGAFLDEVDANTKCTKEARNHYDPDNWRVLEEELVTETPGAQSELKPQGWIEMLWSNLSEKRPTEGQQILVMRKDGEPFVGEWVEAWGTPRCQSRKYGDCVSDFETWIPLEALKNSVDTKNKP